MNDLPTVERTYTPGMTVTVTWPDAVPGGTITATANTAGAAVTPISSIHCTVAPAASGHVDLQLIDGNGELGRARVIFLLTVVFS